MPYYITPQSFLSEIRLRLDALGDDSAALVVEGPEDKKIFHHRISATATIIPATGKTRLRDALNSIADDDKGRILFLTDCDYDVPNGNLKGGPDIIITTNCDVEADLIRLGVLAKVAVEVVPKVVSTDISATRIEEIVRQHAEELTIHLGRIRMAAQPLGADLEFEELDFSKYWSEKNGISVDKIYQVMWNHVHEKTSISRKEWNDRLNSIPYDPILCHGKDLLKATRMFLRRLYKMDNKITPDILAMMIRLAVDQHIFDQWEGTQRIRRWERNNNRRILAL